MQALANTAQTRQIPNLHEDLQSFFHKLDPAINEIGRELIIKIKPADDTEIRDFETKLVAIEGIGGIIKTWKEREGEDRYIVVRFAEPGIDSAKAALIEKQPYVLNAMPAGKRPDSEYPLCCVPNKVNVVVLAEKIEQFTQGLQSVNWDCTMDLDGQREMGVVDIKVTFPDTTSLPKVFFKFTKLAENPECGIIEVNHCSLGQVCTKRSYQRAIQAFKEKHRVETE